MLLLHTRCTRACQLAEQQVTDVALSQQLMLYLLPVWSLVQVLPALVRVLTSPSSQPPMSVEGSLDLLRTLVRRRRTQALPGGGQQQGDLSGGPTHQQQQAEQAAEAAVVRKVGHAHPAQLSS
jgi:hypothetical protein